jgi:myo-inositol-1(or 4)-monophosphatase
MNDRRLRVSARAELKDALFATGTPFNGHDESRHLAFVEELGRVIARTSGVRRFGAASLDLAYVAAGRFDGFWERGLSPWDIAAGAVLVREAGGSVSEIDGGDFMKTGAVVAANAALAPQLTKLVRGG